MTESYFDRLLSVAYLNTPHKITGSVQSTRHLVISQELWEMIIEKAFYKAKIKRGQGYGPDEKIRKWIETNTEGYFWRTVNSGFDLFYFELKEDYLKFTLTFS